MINSKYNLLKDPSIGKDVFFPIKTDERIEKRVDTVLSTEIVIESQHEIFKKAQKPFKITISELVQFLDEKLAKKEYPTVTLLGGELPRLVIQEGGTTPVFHLLLPVDPEDRSNTEQRAIASFLKIHLMPNLRPLCGGSILLEIDIIDSFFGSNCIRHDDLHYSLRLGPNVNVTVIPTTLLPKLAKSPFDSMLLAIQKKQLIGRTGFDFGNGKITEVPDSLQDDYLFLMYLKLTGVRITSDALNKALERFLNKNLSKKQLKAHLESPYLLEARVTLLVNTVFDLLSSPFQKHKNLSMLTTLFFEKIKELLPTANDSEKLIYKDIQVDNDPTNLHHKLFFTTLLLYHHPVEMISRCANPKLEGLGRVSVDGNEVWIEIGHQKKCRIYLILNKQLCQPAQWINSTAFKTFAEATLDKEIPIDDEKEADFATYRTQLIGFLEDLNTQKNNIPSCMYLGATSNIFVILSRLKTDDKVLKELRKPFIEALSALVLQDLTAFKRYQIRSLTLNTMAGEVLLGLIGQQYKSAQLLAALDVLLPHLQPTEATLNGLKTLFNDCDKNNSAEGKRVAKGWALKVIDQADKANHKLVIVKGLMPYINANELLTYWINRTLLSWGIPDKHLLPFPSTELAKPFSICQRIHTCILIFQEMREPIFIEEIVKALDSFSVPTATKNTTEADILAAFRSEFSPLLVCLSMNESMLPKMIVRVGLVLRLMTKAEMIFKKETKLSSDKVTVYNALLRLGLSAHPKNFLPLLNEYASCLFIRDLDDLIVFIGKIKKQKHVLITLSVDNREKWLKTIGEALHLNKEYLQDRQERLFNDLLFLINQPPNGQTIEPELHPKLIFSFLDIFASTLLDSEKVVYLYQRLMNVQITQERKEVCYYSCVSHCQAALLRQLGNNDITGAVLSYKLVLIPLIKVGLLSLNDYGNIVPKLIDAFEFSLKHFNSYSDELSDIFKNLIYAVAEDLTCNVPAVSLKLKGILSTFHEQAQDTYTEEKAIIYFNSSLATIYAICVILSNVAYLSDVESAINQTSDILTIFSKMPSYNYLKTLPTEEGKDVRRRYVTFLLTNLTQLIHSWINLNRPGNYWGRYTAYLVAARTKKLLDPLTVQKEIPEPRHLTPEAYSAMNNALEKILVESQKNIEECNTVDKQAYNNDLTELKWLKSKLKIYNPFLKKKDGQLDQSSLELHPIDYAYYLTKIQTQPEKILEAVNKINTKSSLTVYDLMSLKWLLTHLYSTPKLTEAGKTLLLSKDKGLMTWPMLIKDNLVYLVNGTLASLLETPSLFVSETNIHALELFKAYFFEGRLPVEEEIYLLSEILTTLFSTTRETPSIDPLNAAWIYIREHFLLLCNLKYCLLSKNIKDHLRFTTSIFNTNHRLTESLRLASQGRITCLLQKEFRMKFDDIVNSGLVKLAKESGKDFAYALCFSAKQRGLLFSLDKFKEFDPKNDK